MTFEVEELKEGLGLLVADSIPPSRIDLQQAWLDGSRTRRRRRGLGALAGVATVGAVVLLTAALTAPSGASGPSLTSAAQSTAKSTAKSTGPVRSSAPLAYTSIVPAEFGWLPDSATQINEGYDSYATNYSASTKGGGSADIFLTYYDHTAPPHAGKVVHPAPAGMTKAQAAAWAAMQAHAGNPTLYEVPAPDVNGHQAYWITQTKGQAVSSDGEADLVWQAANGHWLDVDGSGLGSAPVEATIEHIARTVRVGAIGLPMPISITGLPGTTVLTQVMYTVPAHGSSGTFDLDLSLSVGKAGNELAYTAVPVGTVLPPTSGGSSACRTDDGLKICTGTPGPVSALPDGGLQGLLARTVSHGPDPSHWSTALIEP